MDKLDKEVSENEMATDLNKEADTTSETTPASKARKQQRKRGFENPQKEEEAIKSITNEYILNEDKEAPIPIAQIAKDHGISLSLAEKTVLRAYREKNAIKKFTYTLAQKLEEKDCLCVINGRGLLVLKKNLVEHFNKALREAKITPYMKGQIFKATLDGRKIILSPEDDPLPPEN